MCLTTKVYNAKNYDNYVDFNQPRADVNVFGVVGMAYLIP